jgi:hypothetical protein
MINKDGHYLFLCNGGDFWGILEDMDIRSVVDDVCANAKPGQVPKKNSRGNRGPILLFTGSKSQQRKSMLQFAKPIMSPGSKHYAPLFCKITKAICTMAAHQILPDANPFPAPFPVLADMPSCFLDRRSGLVKLEKAIVWRVAVFFFISPTIHFRPKFACDSPATFCNECWDNAWLCNIVWVWSGPVHH